MFISDPTPSRLQLIVMFFAWPDQNGTREFKSLVDIGAEVYCQTRVPDTSRVFINIGIGFHLECSLDEVWIQRSWVMRSTLALKRDASEWNSGWDSDWMDFEFGRLQW